MPIRTLFIVLALLSLLFTGCSTTPAEPTWVANAKKISVGMTRSQAEALLPAHAKIDMSFGSSGNHRDFYAVGEHWRVAIVYRAPFETNLFITEVSTNGQKVTHGPFNGWGYRATPDQKVITVPIIKVVRSRESKFVDPIGSFTAEKPIRRNP